ncbi:hypothetical protein ACOHYD_01925 [Desulfobacterota bacterium M19]
MTDTFICSQCCGQSRAIENCEGCSFYKDASANRNYRKVPYYTTEEMAANFDLEEISQVIETALCQVWASGGAVVNDRTAVRMIELMLNKYHFKEEEKPIKDSVESAAYHLFYQAIDRQLTAVPEEKLVKVLAAVYRSIQRRSNGSNSYLKFISQFTGVGYGN